MGRRKVSDLGGITPELVEGFARDGAVILRQGLDVSWLSLLAEGVGYNRANPSPWAHGFSLSEPEADGAVVGFWSDYVTWPSVPQFQRVIFESGLANVAGQLMGSSEVRLFHEHVLVKEPGTSSRTPWHHDQPYYCVNGDQNVSLWIALDSVPKNGGLRFIAGSHRWDRWFVPRRFADHVPYTGAIDQYELVPDLDEEIDQHQILSWDVEPGDVIAFHYRTLHDAPGNQLATRRRAVSLRWLGDDATFAERPWETSPPFEPRQLVVGGSLADDDRFPLVPFQA